MSSLRRIPPAVWILLPAVLGLLYAAGHALWAPAPQQGRLPPGSAMVTWRFRNLDAYERCAPGPRHPGAPSARDRMAQARNVPGLKGVARGRPVLEVWLPLPPLRDETLTILPVSDADEFRAHFNDVERIEKGFLRHAQHLELRGEWAAIGADREAVRRLGEGGLSPADRGADMEVAADLPRLAAFALQRADVAPWRDILAVLGVRTQDARWTHESAGQPARLEIPDAQAIARLLDGWRSASLWAWMEESRVEIELEPQPDSPLPSVLAAAHEARIDEFLPLAPARSPIALYVTSGLARRALAHILLHLGADLTAATDLPAAVAELETTLATRDPAGPLLVYAERAQGTGSALNLGFVTVGPRLPDLSPLLGDVPALGSGREIAPGEAPATLGVAVPGRARSPAGRVLHGRVGTPERPWTVLAVGASPEALIEGLRQEALAPSGRTLPEQAGWTVLATWHIAGDRVAGLLGAAVEPGGLLQALAGQPLDGDVLTDGRVLRIRAHGRSAPAR